MASARQFSDIEVYALWHKLFRLFDYQDGVLIHKQGHRNYCAGDVAGCLNSHGYHRIVVNKVEYRRYQLIWLMFTGNLVPGLDHRDGVRNNDRLENLRLATRQQNAFNRKIHVNNSSGIVGVREIQPGYWTARITVNGRIICLGSGSFEKAVALRRETERVYFGDFVRRHV